MPPGGDTRVRRREDVVLRRAADEALLVDETGGQVHVVNGTAARLWELLAGGPTLDGLVAAMAAAYSLEPDAVRGDVERMVGTFRELGLLEPEPGE